MTPRLLRLIHHIDGDGVRSFVHVRVKAFFQERFFFLYSRFLPPWFLMLPLSVRMY